MSLINLIESVLLLDDDVALHTRLGKYRADMIEQARHFVWQ